MQPISSYSKDNHLRVVLQGPPGAGKSCLAMQFPRPYFIDIDVNLGGPIRWAERNKQPLPIGYDRLDIDETGLPIPEKQRCIRLDKLLKEAQMNPSIDTIVLDSATMLVDVLINEVLRQQGKNDMHDWKDGRQFWGYFTPFAKHFFATLSQFRKHVVLNAHEKINKDSEGSIIYPVKLAWPGQIGQIIGAFFTDVWRCELKSTPVGMETKYEYLVRTMDATKYELKNGLGLPPVFKFDWQEIAKRLAVGK